MTDRLPSGEDGDWGRAPRSLQPSAGSFTIDENPQCHGRFRNTEKTYNCKMIGKNLAKCIACNTSYIESEISQMGMEKLRLMISAVPPREIMASMPVSILDIQALSLSSRSPMCMIISISLRRAAILTIKSRIPSYGGIQSSLTLLK